MIHIKMEKALRFFICRANALNLKNVSLFEGKVSYTEFEVVYYRNTWGEGATYAFPPLNL